MKTAFVLIWLLLTFGPGRGQERQYSGDVRQDVRAVKVKAPEGLRLYYSWDIGVCYLTGLDLPNAKKAWLTAAHLFAEKKSVRLNYLNNAGQPESRYLNNARYVGNDICQFFMGHDAIPIKLDLPSALSVKIDYSPLDFLPLAEPLSAYSLVDSKRYDAVALFVMLSPLGEIRGLVIARETTFGDCGSGFIVGEDKDLYIVIRALPTNQEQVDQLQSRLAGVSCAALAVYVSFYRKAK